MAQISHLLQWLDTLRCGERATDIEELSDGKVLLQCTKSVFPELSDEEGTDVSGWHEPWPRLWKLLEGYCDCSLDQSISLELLQSGDHEHLARVLVLLLCAAVSHEGNEMVISKVQTLPSEAQHHLMFFIENTLSKVNSDAVATGRFTSGVGEVIGVLGEEATGEEEEDTSYCLPPLPTLSDGDVCDREATPVPAMETPFRCPSRFPRPTPQKYLESPAVLSWLRSPAIRNSSQPIQLDPKEEVVRLQHQVRVLRKSLEIQKNLAHDYYQEVCHKTSLCSQLEDRCLRAESKLKQLEVIPDLEEELHHARQELEKTENSLEGIKARADELEETLAHERKECQCDERLGTISRLEEQVEHLTISAFEKSLEDQKAGMKLQTLSIDLDTKKTQLAALMEEKEESAKAMRDLSSQVAELLEDKRRLHTQLETRYDQEQALREEIQKLRVESMQEYAVQVECERAQVRGEFVMEKKQLKEEVDQERKVFEMEKKQLKEELDRVRKLLKKEQQNRGKLLTEKMSLETQLRYASHKLREAEMLKQRPSQPSLHQSSTLRASHNLTSSIFATSYQPRTSEEEYYYCLQSETGSQSDSLDVCLDDSDDEDGDRLQISDLEPVAPDQTALRQTGSHFSSRRCVASMGLPSTDSRLSMIHEQEDEEGDPRLRLSELQKRNAKQLPHLKSSYPIEMQGQPESPTSSDSLVKHGRMEAERRLTSSKLATRVTGATKGLSFEVDLNSLPSPESLLETRKRSRSYRKQAEEHFSVPIDSLCRSPLPNRRRTSAPPTPETIVPRRFTQNYNVPQSRTATMAPSALNLRNFLDKQPVDGEKRGHSAAFEVAFSPPKGKGKVSVPKRLQENPNATRTVSASLGDKAAGVSRKTRSQAAKERASARTQMRTALKCRNK